MPGKVVMLTDGQPIAFHEERRHESLGRIIAELKGYEFEGVFDFATDREAPLYFVPHYTIVGRDFASAVGMHTPDDFFGGVVPSWFLATKAIIHKVPRPEAARPEGWNERFTEFVGEFVLPGYAAFDARDAYAAGEELLGSGPIRLKDVFAAGGDGQIVVCNADDLRRELDRFSRQRRAHWAIVLELNLEQIVTYSVGQIYLAGITISYWGTQRLTCDNYGNAAYGGSDLHVVRGGFDVAAALAPGEEERSAVQAAFAFDTAMALHYPEILASRKNYDVAIGRDANGALHCGVLDQSWRIGGTSGVEVAAVRIFKDRNDARFVKGSSNNVYGGDAVPPPNAIVHFHDVDHEFGPMLMYTTIEDVG